MTIDVEDWNESFGRQGLPEDLKDSPSRIEASMDRLLEMMSLGSSLGTFFVLGTVAEKHPDLVRRIAKAGHEVGVHGWEHRSLESSSPAQLRKDLTRARALMQDLSGQETLGYRAPWFSLNRGTAWAEEVLQECGFSYDSSIFPCWNGIYGDSSAPRGVYRKPSGLFEIPPAVTRLGPIRIPVAGGFYWRMFPRFLLRWGVERLAREGYPAVLYLHPWELDTEQPRVRRGLFADLVHYGNLSRAGKVFQWAIEQWKLGPIREVFPQVASPAGLA